jgi:ammonium transporter Rh
MEPLLGGKATQLNTGAFLVVCLVMQAVICYLLKGTDYKLSDAKDLDKESIYNFYVGVALMMFVGFGYLMTFLKAYGLGAVGFTMLITCLGVEWALCVEQLMASGKIVVDLYAILNGNFAVAAVLISFGGLIGKISPTQVAVLTVIELVCYCANKVYFLTNFLEIADCGGTIIIHLFGAYFGLACSAAMGPATTNEGLNGSDYKSDLFSLIGTTFLWLFWPSFVAGALPAGDGQDMAIINTILALIASTVITFALTPMFSGAGRLTTVPIQNATLAGGVSIGATANLPLGPFGAVLIGLLAGALSTIGFCKPLISAESDTCGINNLHGMPGLLGGLASAALPTFVEGTGVVMKNQLIGVGGTFVIAIVTGAITGLILKCVRPLDFEAFTDETFWDCADDVATE